MKFRRGAALPFGLDMEVADNELRFGLDGQGIASVARSQVATVVAGTSIPGPESPAYSLVLLDILNGGSTLSVGREEAEQAWRVLTPVLQAWVADRVPLQEYPAGSEIPPLI